MSLLITDFLNYLKDNKGYSPETIKSYSSDLGSFVSFLSDSYDLDDISKATKNIIRSYLVHLSERKLSPRSINRQLSTLKTFYNYLLKNELVDINPVNSIPNLKLPERLPVYVNEEAIDDLLHNTISISDRVVLLLLYCTGMRRAELINLKLSDIDVEQKTIKVLGKGNKERIIPVSIELLDVVKEYIDFRGHDLDHEYLITTKKGKKAYPKYVYNIVNKYLKQLGVTEKNSPHILRHTFATHLLNNGSELNAVKDLLGHSSLAATQVYTHNSLERLKKAYKNHHPKK